MSISFDLPASVEDQLRRELADLDVVAKEALLVELYRQGRITHHQLGLSLGLERHETDGLLKRHKGVKVGGACGGNPEGHAGADANCAASGVQGRPGRG